MRRVHHFDQMLPLFQIVTPRFKAELDKAQQKIADLSEIPDSTQYRPNHQQSRRRIHRRRHHHLEVGVHRAHKKPSSGTSIPHKHSFSANFPTEPKLDAKPREEDIYYNIDDDTRKETTDGVEIPTLETIYRDDNFDSHVKTTELILDQVDDGDKTRIKKKQLVKENVKLLEENRRLFENMELIEQKLVDKEIRLSGLYEKIEQIKYVNKEILEENLVLRNRVQEPCARCTDVKRVLEEHEKCKETNRTLHVDVEMLKNVVYRLNVELERYQELVRKRHEWKENDEPGTDLVAASWGDVNSHTLGPLLDAYQDAMGEKEEIIRTYQKEIDEFTGKLKQVVAENELLHRKIVDDDDERTKRTARIDEIDAENRLLKEQNEQMGKKCEIVESKIRDLMKMYEQKVESMSRDYDALHSQYHKSRTEFCTLQGKYETLADSTDKQKRDNEHMIPVEVHNETLKEYKRLLEDARVQHESDRVKHEQRIRDLEQRGPELENRIVELRADKRELQIGTKSLQQTIRKLQLKHEQTQANLVTSQVARDSCRKQLQRAYEFSRELVHEQETLLAQIADKQRENRQMQIAGIGFVSKLDSFRNQLKSIQREATHSLESSENRDADVEALKIKFDREIEQLSKNLSKKDEGGVQKDRDGTKSSASITMASCVMYKDRTVAGGDG